MQSTQDPEVHYMKHETIRREDTGLWEERWYCEEDGCGREVVYDPEKNVWITICKGDQLVIHHGSVGGLQFSGDVGYSIPPQFKEFLIKLGFTF